MKTYRDNPDSEENERATKQNEREKFALKMMPAAQKSRLIIAGLRRATCKYCGNPGITRLCRCNARMILVLRNHSNYHPLILAGPIGKLP